jgi:hypothetical protein
MGFFCRCRNRRWRKYRVGHRSDEWRIDKKVFFQSLPNGELSLTIPKDIFAPKAEVRIRFDEHGTVKTAFRDNILHATVFNSNVDIIRPTLKAGAEGAEETYPQTNVFVLFQKPVLIITPNQISAKFTGSNAPVFAVRDFGPYWVVLSKMGPVPSGDLDIFVSGENP